MMATHEELPMQLSPTAVLVCLLSFSLVSGVQAAADAAAAKPDESLMMDSARALDLEQRALAKWDLELAETLLSQGNGEAAAKKVEEAQTRYRAIRAAYEEALEAYPSNARAHNYYGELLFDAFKRELDAVSHWQKAAELDPSLALPHANLGAHHHHSGRVKEGLKHYQRAVELDSENPDILYSFAQIYLISWPDLERELNKTAPELYQDAMAMSEKAARLAPDDYELARDYALNYFAGERMNVQVDWSKAAAAWQEAVRLAPNHIARFHALLYEARARMRGGDWDAAERALHESLKIMPQSEPAQTLLERVRAGRGAGDTAQAE
jgi:tetratricopeptide (TPR) repeat protein